MIEFNSANNQPDNVFFSAAIIFRLPIRIYYRKLFNKGDLKLC